MIFSKPLSDISFISDFATLPHVSGKLITFISSLEEEEVQKRIKSTLDDITPVYSECVDLTLDEIFTLEVSRVKGGETK